MAQNGSRVIFTFRILKNIQFLVRLILETVIFLIYALVVYEIIQQRQTLQIKLWQILLTIFIRKIR